MGITDGLGPLPLTHQAAKHHMSWVQARVRVRRGERTGDENHHKARVLWA